MASETGTSIVELVKGDHQNVKSLFSRLDTTPMDKLEGYFCELRELLVRHEVAEELTVYPVFRSNVPGGEQIAEARIAEQAEAEEKLAELEKMDAATPSFLEQLKMLRTAVLAHAEREEETVFAALAAHLPTDRLEEMGHQYTMALKAAPTHPHPHAPDTPPGNVVLGPVAAIMDRMRDAMRKAS